MKAEVSQSEGILKVSATSVVKQRPHAWEADGYQQTLVILLADKDRDIQSFSESERISFTRRSHVSGGGGPTVDRGEQTASWTIPDRATAAIVAAKCNFSLNRKRWTCRKGMGMRVKVIEVVL